ncbi:MAG: hypothetical protein ACTSYM_10580 [Candidatus Baldrarchaeia archaeon]
MRKILSAVFVLMILIAFLAATFSYNQSAYASENLSHKDTEEKTANNVTLIVYPDQTIEIRFLREETPGTENITADISFECSKENETYIGSSDILILPPTEELGIFAYISSLSLNGSYTDNKLIGTGAMHFLSGLPIASILLSYELNETLKKISFEMESQLPISSSPMPPFQMLPEQFVANVTYLIESISIENCTFEIVNSETTVDTAFIDINVTANENFILGKFSGFINLTANFTSDFLESVFVDTLLEGEGNAKFQAEISLNFTDGVLTSISFENAALTDSENKWALTVSGEADFTNDPSFTLTSLSGSLTIEGNITEALSDLVDLLTEFSPSEERVFIPEELIELIDRLSVALSTLEIEELEFELSYANEQFSSESSFEISGDIDYALSEVKDAFLDFISEIELNITEEVWFEFLSNMDIKCQHILLEIDISLDKNILEVTIDRMETEVEGTTTAFRYPFIFETLNETGFEGILSIVGGENETHIVVLNVPENVPEPMEQTDRYAIWNITENFDITLLGNVEFISVQVIFPTVIGGQTVEIGVVANVTGVTITSVSYESSYTAFGMSKGLKFIVSGPSGTAATVNITIPKEIVPSGAPFTIYVDGEKVYDAEIIETETEYIIMVTVHFSEVIIYVEFTTPVERYLFAIIGGVVVLLLIIVAAATLLRKKK